MANPVLLMSWLVWGILFLCIGIYTALVTLILKPQGTQAATAVLVSVFYGTAVMNLLLAFVIRLFLRRTVQKADRTREWVGKYLGMAIVIWALSEAVAVYGLVLYLMGANLVTFFIFAAVSAAAMLANTPSLLTARKQGGAISPLGH